MAGRSVVDAVDAHGPAMAGRPDAELRDQGRALNCECSRAAVHVTAVDCLD